jgi:hypothetical protein
MLGHQVDYPLSLQLERQKQLQQVGKLRNFEAYLLYEIIDAIEY